MREFENLQEYIGVNWIATEKIHGCNYSFMCDNHLNVIPCKRRSVINYEEDFMNHQKIFDKYKAVLVTDIVVGSVTPGTSSAI